MHRSGTSLLTRLCSLAGASLPSDLIGASDSNASGHWESRRLVAFNDEVLGRAGQDWSDFTPVDLTQRQQDDYVRQLRRIIAEDYGDASFIVMKDPRATRFTDLTCRALEEAGYRVCPVHAVRHPVEVARSLASRNAMPDAFAGLLWLRYALDAELALTGRKHRILSYADMMARPEDSVRELFTHFGLPEPSETFSKDAADFVRLDLRHHKGVDWTGTPAVFRDWILSAYDVLDRAAPKPPTAKGLAELKRIDAEFRLASDALRDVAADGKAASDRLTEAEGQVADLTRQIEATRKDSKAAEARDLKSIQTLQGELRDSQTALNTVREDFHRQSAQLTQKLEDRAKRHQKTLIRIRSLEAERDRIAVELESTVPVKQERDALQARLSQLSQVVGEVQTPENLAERVGAVARNNQLRGERLVQVEAQLDFVSRRANQLETALDELRGSTFWRMTAPLRHAVNLWRNKSHVLFKLLAGHEMRSLIRDAELDPALDASRSPSVRAARDGLQARRPGVLSGETSLPFRSVRKAVEDKDLPTLTISAVTYNASRWLDGFFKSLVALDYPLSKLTLHVVDHGSTDDTAARVSVFKSGPGAALADVILSKRDNLGYGAGNDFAIRQSDDDLVLITNVDVSFYPQSLRRCVEFALSDPDDTACWEFRQTPYEHPKYYDPVTLETNWNAHACVLMRKDAYIRAGGYDTRIFMYGEDVELSYRLRAHGYVLRYVPEAVVEHYVDLEDQTLRPHQLSGSTAANILLRYRYGSRGDKAAGEALLQAVKRNETDPERAKAFAEVSRILTRDRWHFWMRRPGRRLLRKTGAAFPFNEFDYGVTRIGADVIRRPFLPKERKTLPLVTIVTRTHGDNLHHVRNAVACVQNQTYPNIEHLIVEDRTDAARDYVDGLSKRFGKDRIRYLKSPGQGRSECGNHGAREARGEWLCWYDNDDLLFADHVETLVRALDDEPDAVASYALAWDAHSRTVEGEPVVTRFDLPAAHRQPYDPDRLKVENFIPIQSILFRKSLFERFGGFNPEFDQLEDWNLWVRYSQAGPFVFTPKVTSIYLTPDDEEERQRRHLQLHAAYDTVSEQNWQDVASIQRKLEAEPAQDGDDDFGPTALAASDAG
jgi:GT2 family glycosyltransferase